MKKTAVALLLLLITSHTDARVALRDIITDIDYGVDGGLAVSTLSGPSDQSSKLGLVAGGTASYQFSPSGYLDAFFGLVQRGSNSDGDVLKLNYLALPVTLRYNLPVKGAIQPFVYAGGYSAILLSAKFEGEDVDDAVHTHDFGALYGVGFLLPLQQSELSVKIGYEAGLKSVTTFNGEAAKNRSLVIKGGLRF